MDSSSEDEDEMQGRRMTDSYRQASQRKVFYACLLLYRLYTLSLYIYLLNSSSLSLLILTLANSL